jgi:putative resolvase
VPNADQGLLRAHPPTPSTRATGGAGRGIHRRLSDPDVGTVVAEHRDRLGRMHIELGEAALRASGRRLVILDEGEVGDDPVRDMVEVLNKRVIGNSQER